MQHTDIIFPLAKINLGLGYDLYNTALEKGIGTKLLLWESPAQCE